MKGAFFSIKFVTAAMQAQKSGAIVVMCSDQTLVGSIQGSLKICKDKANYNEATIQLF